MIVVAVGPSRRIHLSCRDSHTSHCIYSKYRFFATSSVSSSVHSNCRKGSLICAVVCGFLCTPVIYFKSCCLSVKGKNTLTHLLPEKGTARRHFFLVYTAIQHVIQENLLRKSFYVFSVFPEPYCIFSVVLKDFRLIVCNVAVRHCNIHILACQSCIFLPFRNFLIHFRHTLRKGFFQFFILSQNALSVFR